MNIRLLHLPIWLGAFVGLLAGYLLGRGALAPEASAADGPDSRSRTNSPHEGTTAENAAAAQKNGDNRRFLIPKDKLAKLRGAHHSLVFNLKSFRQSPNAETDATFDALREMLDLTPEEEKQLRDLLSKCANELADYEKQHSSVTHENDRCLVLHLPARGKQEEELCHRITQGLRETLGDERAAILDALAHPDSIIRSRLQWAGIGEIKFQPGGPKPANTGWIEVRAENMARLVSVNGATSTEQLPVAQLSEAVFEGYEHLIDTETRTKFIERAVHGE